MPKVICIDNYGRDNISDTLMAENLTEEAAQALREEYQAKYGGECSSNYYVVRPDDYQLYKWEP